MITRAGFRSLSTGHTGDATVATSLLATCSLATSCRAPVTPRDTPRLASLRSATHTPMAQAIALVLMCGVSAQAAAQRAPTPLSPAWVQSRSTAPPSAPATAPGGSRLSNSGGVTDPAGALRDPAVQRSIANLKTSAAAIAAAQAQQKQAADAARALPSAFDGLGEGALKLVPGVADSATAPTRKLDGSLWQNAELPTQTVDAGRTTVTVRQTAKKAILNWETFNVGRNTTLHLDQRGGAQSGGNEWIALNRVNDPSGRPSQILGQIKAEGSVYVLNRNGVIFGAGSQVSTQSLLVSSLNLFSADVAESNRIFLERGLAGVARGAVVLDGTALVRAGTAPGDIRIQAGADIATAPGGFSLIAAPNVDNAGSIRANDGQAVLAATLRVTGQGDDPNGARSSTQLPVIFSEIGTDAGQAVFTRGLVANGLGVLKNTGVVVASRGGVLLSGDRIEQHGVVVATSGINRPGSVSVQAVDHVLSATSATGEVIGDGVLDIGSGSLTALLPEYDGATTTSSAAATAAFDPGRILLTGSTTVRTGALVLAPGALVRIFNSARAGRVFIDSGATISVAGLPDVQLPVGVNLVSVPRIGQNELADTPLQRDGELFRKPIVIDARIEGRRADGSSFVGSPVLNAGGYVDQVPRTIGQLLIDGGTIDISTSQLYLQPGSTLALDGGYIHFLGGMVQTRRLIGADGRITRLADADPMQTYLGFAGAYTRNYARWGVSETFIDPLLGSDRRVESDYLHGGDAGALRIAITGVNASVGAGSPLNDTFALLDGDISAHAWSGRYQVRAAEQARGGNFSFGGLNVQFRRTVGAQLPDGFDPDTDSASLPAPDADIQDPTNRRFWAALDSERLAAAGLSSLRIDGAGQINVAADAQLRVQPGGTITLHGTRVDVQGALVARSGAIDLQTGGQFAPLGTPDPNAVINGGITIGPQARLDARGEWVNDRGLLPDDQRGSAHIDGGSIRLATIADNDGRLGADGRVRDTGGSVVLDPGATLDVTSGGRVLANGELATSRGRPAGRGGDISLLTNVHTLPLDGIPGTVLSRNPQANDGVGLLRLDGAHLLGNSLGGGGTLTLRARSIVIGEAAVTDPRDLHLAADAFADGGFGAYVLQADLDATITAGSQVRVSQRVLRPDASALVNAASGTDIFAGIDNGFVARGRSGANAGVDAAGNAFGQLGALDPSRQPATQFSLSAGDFLGRARDELTGTPIRETGTTLLDRGARLLLDPGAQVRLGSRGQVTVLGEIIARGGSITLSGDTSATSALSPPPDADVPGNNRGKYGRADHSVWLGGDSVLDVSGIALIDPFAAPARDGDGNAIVPRTGRVLDGGRITLTNDGGYVVVREGAQLRLDGAADRFDLPTDRAGTATGSDVRAVPTGVWSDGGRLTLAASAGLFFDGRISAASGSAQARGGTLTVLPLQGPAAFTASGVVIQQTGSRLDAAAQPGGVIEPSLPVPSGRLYLAADRLNDSGIDNLIIGNQTPGARVQVGSEPPVVPVYFSGDVSLSLRGALQLNATDYVLVDSALRAPGLSDAAGTATDADAGAGGNVRLQAAYVGFNGFRALGSSATAPVLALPPAPLGAGRLWVGAQAIDLGGQFVLRNVADAAFVSSGDLRFRTPAPYAFLDSSVRSASPLRVPGELLTAGNLTLQAAQVYPATAETFIVRAVGALDARSGQRADTVIRLLPNGRSVAPLSAGGTLLIDATRIEQAGTLRAPAGRLVLGVGDVAGSATRALYGDRTVVATQQVRFADGSLTSVSLDGQVVPYGTTVDGLQWTFKDNPGLTGVGRDLTAAPAKQVQAYGADVTLAGGATVDLSGGGDLQAIEWVAGTGGSRDVLSQFNTSFADGGAGTPVALYPDQRGVYAVLPGVQPRVAAADPLLDAGQAPIGVGQSVMLRGVPGLTDGVYTLLPAKYATLPGAYRLVQRADRIDAVGSRNSVLPDGTVVVAGRMVDGLTGALDARATQFELQSREVWGKYSQYTLTRADAFFAALAKSTGVATPRLLRDGGQLVLGASDTLHLGATLDTRAAKDGAAALVDIASQAIQITGSGQPARAGFVQLDAADVGALAASSLLIGGTRRQTDAGLLVDVVADRVLVSNDARDPLRAPEIILVARPGAPGDADAGVQVAAGSVIEAVGTLPAASGAIVIGEAPAADGSGGVSGDGALLRVSNAGTAAILRRNVPLAADARGRLLIGAGARIDGGAALTLDATGQTSVPADAVLRGTAIDASAGRITFSSDAATAAASGGLVVGSGTLAQFAAARAVSLRSYGAIDFLGDVSVDLPQALTLSAATLRSDGGSVRLGASQLTIDNALGGSSTTDAGSVGAGTLQLRGSDVVFGAGTTTLAGFGAVSADASTAIHGSGRGRFDAGSLDITLRAPVVQADAGADATLLTRGAITIARSTGVVAASSALGGAITLDGGRIIGNGLVRANAGTVTLRARSGDLSLDDGALVDVSGAATRVFDTTLYAPGGTIALSADAGRVRVAQGARLDVSSDDGGGSAGTLEVRAPQQTALLLGSIDGSAPKGIGGSLLLDVGGAVDLDALAARLASSGVNRSIDVRSRSGNLLLSRGSTLTASAVTLTADGGSDTPARDDDAGNVVIDGHIDASGSSGGSIALWGRSGVAVDGTLLANGTRTDRRGGTVSLGTGGQGDGSLETTYGYQNVQAGDAGTLRIGSNARINVSGGNAGGLTGGRLALRAPLLSNGDINLDISDGARIDGARTLDIEAYAVWSATDASANAWQHFDGIVDPAGWYDATGTLVAGTWTDRSGTVLPPPTTPEQLAQYRSTHYFSPDAAAVNRDHQRFYGYVDGDAGSATPGTLMGFVQQPGFAFAPRFARFANLRVQAGVELRNPTDGPNGGSIRVLSNWNLGSGTSLAERDFRSNGVAPVLTLRAAGDLRIDASISDGFYNRNANSGGGGGDGIAPADYAAALAAFDAANARWIAEVGAPQPLTNFLPMPELLTGGDMAELAQYYGQYVALVTMLNKRRPDQLDVAGGLVVGFLSLYALGIPEQATPDQPPAPVAPTAPGTYAPYIDSYETYALATLRYFSASGFLAPLVRPELPLVGPVAGGGIAGADRSPSLQASASNPTPFADATLAGGDSSSFRFIAGADTASTAPTATRGDADSGDVVLDGHTTRGADGERDILVPNVVRTGTGSITIVANGDLRFADAVAPASIYTAGRPGAGTDADGATPEVRSFSSTLQLADGSTPGLLVNGQVNPEAGGDITLLAGRDVRGNRAPVDADGRVTGVAGNTMAQYWWPWMQTGNRIVDGRMVASSINFSGFAQGVMSAGGNVRVGAGRDVRELSVSLPTTWTLSDDGAGGAATLRTFGGGNLSVDAGRDVLGGDYFVARGEGDIRAGGTVGSAASIAVRGQGTAADGSQSLRTFLTDTAPVFALQDAQLRVQAGGDLDIGAVVNPSYTTPLASGIQLPLQLLTGDAKQTDSTPYSAQSALEALSLGGDVRFGTLRAPGALFAFGDTINPSGSDRLSNLDARVFTNTLPASLSLAALRGDVSVEDGGELAPSASGSLQLIANGSLRLFGAQTPVERSLRMLDIDATRLLPSQLDTLDNDTQRWNPASFDANRVRTDQANLHINDAQPVLMYALNGDILGGTASGVQDAQNLQLVLPKQARIRAGRDVVDLDLRGQNLLPSDVTSVIAGRDLFYRPFTSRLIGDWAWLEVGGPGTFELQAGRNLGPLTSANDVFAAVGNSGVFPVNAGGVRSIGNRDNAALPFEGADIVARFGVAPGIDTAAFAGAYLDPSNAASAPYRSQLVEFVAQIERDRRQRVGDADSATADAGISDAAQAWRLFQQQPLAVQQRLVDAVFLDVLARVGIAFNTPNSSGQNRYIGGYRAVETLFPAALGYTVNNLDGGANGAASTLSTGSFDMRGSTVQTEQGGNIRLLGPGGGVLVGSLSAPPLVRGRDGQVIIGPNQQGILTLARGDIGVFTDASVRLAQSRVFTQRGGDVVIWSSNGDINAGSGAKTVSDTPPVTYICTLDFNCRIDAKGQVSGAGIATLQTSPGAPTGNAVLVAPRGTVDAGDAGIRVSGNLVVAAATVANGDNIQVQGEKVGVPTVAAVNVSALSAASSAATAASQVAQDIARRQQDDSAAQAGSVISVDVTGFGG